MPLIKQPVTINFSKGLDTKTDPWQVAIGNFLKLQNSIFTKAGLLQKRNGFGQLTALPDNTSKYLTTFNGGLTAIGTSLSSYSQGAGTWTNKGSITPLDLRVNSLVRNNLNQQYADSAIASNGLICTVYTENNNGTLSYKYTVSDSVTNQVIVAPKLIVGTGTTTNAPRVFYLYPYFIIVFDDLISATNHLQYIAVSVSNPLNATAASDLSTTYSAASTGTFDGVVVNSNLYIFFNGSSTTIKGLYLSNTLNLSSPISFASQSCTTISVTDDQTGSYPIIYASWIVPSTGQIKGLATDGLLNTVLAPTQIVATSAAVNIASAAQNGVLTVYYEVTNAYSYDGGVPSNFISTNTLTKAGAAGTPSILIRSVGLASKTVVYNDVIYFLAIYKSPYQSTYFLINQSAKVVATFAYENGPGYYVTGLPTVTINGSAIQVPYLYKDLIAAVNKDTDVSSGTQVTGIYSQTGINLLTINFGTDSLITNEIGNNLNISGGFVTMYDGVAPVEQNFFLYPDSVELSMVTTGGNLADQQYFYQATYEWTDNQGNAFRSAPSIPVTITTTGGSTSSNTINVPTLRLTYKASSPVKIVIYRWSVGNPIYYQVTSITAPILNSVTSDSVSFVDTLSDTTIRGNNILYTNGGVVEDIGPPATSAMFLFDDRPWLIDAEDRNLLWYGKQVIEATPSEFSDLFTVYIAPSTSSEGSSGELNFGFPMDDKAILFKDSALYYFNGTGPDNTGANSQYSQPIFITSTVGSSNQKSCVLIPSGLMFQSSKGIWLLGRDLSTTYIGAPVEEFNSNTVLSAINIPSENQVRFTLDNGVTLMYDYFYGQWGTFVGIPAISSTTFGGLHTFINSLGQVYQEKPGFYLDGSNPVLLGFTTSWLNLAGLQGYQRAYFFYLLGKYLTPHKLQMSIAYDYNDCPEQVSIISPINFSPAYGAQSSNGQQTVYGQNTPYGGPGNVERWRVFLAKQKCQAFQITLQEIYDPSFGIPAGQGLTLSGMNLIAAVKKGYRPISAANSVGSS